MGPIQRNHPRTAQIKENIVERVFLYLESTREKANRDAFSLLNRLEVVAVSSIVVERRIKFSQWSSSTPVSEQSSACLGRNTTQEVHTLYVVPESLEWFDVSLALIEHLSKQSSPDSVIVLETLLKSDLKGLQRKGFNVNRILHKKQKQQEEANANALAERERLKVETQDLIRMEKANAVNQERSQPKAITGPGAPSQTNAGQPQKSISESNGTQNPRGNEGGSSKDKNPNLQPGIPPVLPIARSNTQQGFFSRMFKPAVPSQPQSPVPGSRNNANGKEGDNSSLLNKGIMESKPFTSGSLNTPPRAPAPVPNNINTDDACNYSEATNLTLATRLQGGPPVYLSPGMPSLTELWILEAARFKSILFIISQNIFEIPWNAIHMYLNTASRVIAFNYGGSLFFNLNFFIGNSLTPVRNLGEAMWNPVGQLDYWFTVFAHEIAHNLCGPHGSTHSYFTLVTIFFFFFLVPLLLRFY